MSGTEVILTASERKNALPQVATNRWHSALSMFPGVWEPDMAAFPVADARRPEEKFAVVVHLDYHHDAALSRVFFSGKGEAIRTEFKATPQIAARRVELGLPSDEAAQFRLADKVIHALLAERRGA